MRRSGPGGVSNGMYRFQEGGAPAEDLYDQPEYGKSYALRQCSSNHVCAAKSGGGFHDLPSAGQGFLTIVRVCLAADVANRLWRALFAPAGGGVRQPRHGWRPICMSHFLCPFSLNQCTQRGAPQQAQPIYDRGDFKNSSTGQYDHHLPLERHAHTCPGTARCPACPAATPPPRTMTTSWKTCLAPPSCRCSRPLDDLCMLLHDFQAPGAAELNRPLQQEVWFHGPVCVACVCFVWWA